MHFWVILTNNTCSEWSLMGAALESDQSKKTGKVVFFGPQNFQKIFFSKNFQNPYQKKKKIFFFGNHYKISKRKKKPPLNNRLVVTSLRSELVPR